MFGGQRAVLKKPGALRFENLQTHDCWLFTAVLLRPAVSLIFPVRSNAFLSMAISLRSPRRTFSAIAFSLSAHLFPRELKTLSRPHLTAPRLEIKRNVKQ